MYFRMIHSFLFSLLMWQVSQMVQISHCMEMNGIPHKNDQSKNQMIGDMIADRRGTREHPFIEREFERKPKVSYTTTAESATFGGIPPYIESDTGHTFGESFFADHPSFNTPAGAASSSTIMVPTPSSESKPMVAAFAIGNQAKQAIGNQIMMNTTVVDNPEQGSLTFAAFMQQPRGSAAAMSQKQQHQMGLIMQFGQAGQLAVLKDQVANHNTRRLRRRPGTSTGMAGQTNGNVLLTLGRTRKRDNLEIMTTEQPSSSGTMMAIACFKRRKIDMKAPNVTHMKETDMTKGSIHAVEESGVTDGPVIAVVIQTNSMNATDFHHAKLRECNSELPKQNEERQQANDVHRYLTEPRTDRPTGEISVHQTLNAEKFSIGDSPILPAKSMPVMPGGVRLKPSPTPIINIHEASGVPMKPLLAQKSPESIEPLNVLDNDVEDFTLDSFTGDDFVLDSFTPLELPETAWTFDENGNPLDMIDSNDFDSNDFGIIHPENQIDLNQNHRPILQMIQLMFDPTNYNNS